MKNILAWIIHSIFPAWIAKLVVEVPTMSDDTAIFDSLVAPTLIAGDAAPIAQAAPAVDLVALAATVVKAVDPAAAPIADAVVALDAMIPAGTIAKLEALLGVMGHPLPSFWAEAVALAKKA